jgi:hypothetical protein
MSDQPCIVVNYDLLGQSATSLRSIGHEFEQTEQIKDHLLGSLGSSEIADAMGDFSGNWDRRRKDLTKKLNEAESAVRSVMASFSAQDRNAAQFDLSHHGGPMMTTTERAQ